MNKFIPWFGGFMIGLILAGFLVGAFSLRSVLKDQADPTFDLVATSWGTPIDEPDLWIYQVQVIAQDANGDGVLEVRGKVGIGSSSYLHDFGPLGTASHMGEAVDKFGDIKWETDKVTIGGSGGIIASAPRSELQQHR